MPPNFDQQARALVDSLPGDEYWIDVDVAIASVARALSAAYRAGMERAAQLADECGYGREAAGKIREEVE